METTKPLMELANLMVFQDGWPSTLKEATELLGRQPFQPQPWGIAAADALGATGTWYVARTINVQAGTATYASRSMCVHRHVCMYICNVM